MFWLVGITRPRSLRSKFRAKIRNKQKENKRRTLPFLPFLFPLELLDDSDVETNDVLGGNDTA